MKKIQVEIWSDFACPWCWIAKRRFEKAVDALAGQIEVDVVHKSYRLARGLAPQALREVLLMKMGSAVHAESFIANIRDNGNREGLVYNVDVMKFGDTGAVHSMLKQVVDPALKQKLVERIYYAATTEGLDIYDHEVLRSFLREAGIAEASVNLQSSAALAEIEQDERTASEIASGIPLFLIDGRRHISGAQDVAVFERALREAAVSSARVIDEPAPAVCGLDGCTQ